MESNQHLITTFFTAFQDKDFKTMGACYHDDATFKDAVFNLQNGNEVRNMWEMLCTGGKDLRVEFSRVEATEKSGAAHWDADYTFSKTGKPVHNSIDSKFEFKDGLIFRHTDTFDFYKWSKQAFGFTGLLLGKTRFFHAKVSGAAAKNLSDFMKSR